jgi:hypothetical protein
MDWLYSFINIVGEMLKGYVRDGWLFALAHLVVFYFLYRSWRNVGKAAQELENWHPQVGVPVPEESSEMGESLKLVPRTSQPVGLLDLYVAESEKMGAQGAFVPMTDYSDRLDSIIDGLISELQDRTNLFLIVGIAGTLFGLFEFAFLSYSELQRSAPQPGGQLLNLGKFLSQSMSKAFPVGFMGLALTFFAQLWSARPEGRLRAALASAAQRALEKRKEASVSQGESLRQAVIAMQKAMQPLENLSSTLSQGLEPVADTFGKRLDELLELVKGQFNEMQQATQNLQEAIGKLQDGVNSFGAVTARVEDLFGQLPDMLNSLASLQDRQRESIEAFDNQVAGRLQEALELDNALKESIQHLGQLPGQLAVEFKNAFTGLSGAALNAWEDHSSEYHKNLQNVYQNFLHSLNGSANGVKIGLSEAAIEWQRLAQNAEHILKEPMKEVFATLRRDLAEDLRRLDRVVAQRYPQAARDITVFTERLELLLEQTDRLQGAVSVWLTGAQEAGNQLQTFNVELAELVRKLPSVEQSGTNPEMIHLLQLNAQQTQAIDRLLHEMNTQLADMGSSISDELNNATKHMAGLRWDFNQFVHRRWFGSLFGLPKKRRGSSGVQ